MGSTIRNIQFYCVKEQSGVGNCDSERANITIKQKGCWISACLTFWAVSFGQGLGWGYLEEFTHSTFMI